jgi:exosortase E/protease (VPEID-CTERM system)
MASDLAPPPKESPPPLPLVRWTCLAVLLIVELLTLTLRFDTVTLEGDTRWWAELLGQSYLLPQVAIAVVVATLFFSGSQLRQALNRVSERRHRSHPWPLFLLAHLLTFAGFALLTAYILEGEARADPYPELWLLAWVLTGLVSLAFWSAVALPPGLWLPLLRHGLGPLLTGAAVGVAAWAAGLLTDLLWRPLGRSTLWAVHQVLRPFCADTVYQPDQFYVGTPQFWIHIAPECSGYEGIGLIWVFLGAYLWLFRRRLRFPQALLLLPLGTAVMWLGNVVRIAALIGLGTRWPEVALGGFHSQAGWLAFNAAALGLVALTRSVRFFAADDPQPAQADEGNATAAYLAPLLAVVATAMITGAFTGGFDTLYPLRVVAAALALWYFRRQYTTLRWTWSWQAVALGVVVFGLWVTLVPPPTSSGDGEADPAAGLASLPAGWAVLWLTFRMAGYVVTVPLAEELAFRGFLTRQLIAADFQAVPPGRFSWLSFLVSSVLFGALHGSWVAGTLAGMLYALALYRRGELADAVLAHVTTNALLTAYVLATGNWYLWS